VRVRNFGNRRKVPNPKYSQSLVHAHSKQGCRSSHMAQVGGRALQNPKVKKSKSVAKSGRNPKNRGKSRHMIENWFQTFSRVTDGRSGAKQSFVLHVRRRPVDNINSKHVVTFDRHKLLKLNSQSVRANSPHNPTAPTAPVPRLLPLERRQHPPPCALPSVCNSNGRCTLKLKAKLESSRLGF